MWRQYQWADSDTDNDWLVWRQYQWADSDTENDWLLWRETHYDVTYKNNIVSF